MCIAKPCWFVLAQTEGADLPPLKIPAWDPLRALATLDVTEIPFRRDQRQRAGLCAGPLHCRLAAVPIAAQDDIPRDRACTARAYGRGEIGLLSRCSIQSPGRPSKRDAVTLIMGVRAAASRGLARRLDGRVQPKERPVQQLVIHGRTACAAVGV